MPESSTIHSPEILVAQAPREWALYEEGQRYGSVTASSADEALQHAIDGVDRDNYPANPPRDQTTIWIDVRVRCEDTGEEDSATVTLDPEEPDCEQSAHDWRSPHSVLGGCETNPGVWGSGGGVTIREVCSHCGVYRVIDTCAQRSDTGEQGLRSTRYEDADAESLAWVASRG